MRALIIMAKDLSQAARDWKTALFLLFMPLVFTVFFGLAALGSPEDARLRMGWVDRETGGASGALGPAIRSMLETSPNVVLEDLRDGSPEAAAAGVREGKLAAAVEVPDGFSTAALAGSPIPLSVIADSGSAAGRAAVEAIRGSAGRALGSATAARLSLAAALASPAKPIRASEDRARSAWVSQALSAALQAWKRPRVSVEIQPATVLKLASGFTQASPGMLVQFAIFGLITSAMIVVMERRSGAMRRLLTTSTSPAAIVGGHLAAMFLIVLAQEAILVACGQLFFGVDYLRAPLAIFVMAVALAAWAAALGLLIGALARKEQQVIAYSLAAMFIFAALGGAWFPLDVAGAGFSRIGHMLPSAWAMTGLQNIVLRGEGFASVLVPAGILLAWAAGFFVIAAWRFRFE